MFLTVEPSLRPSRHALNTAQPMRTGGLELYLLLCVYTVISVWGHITTSVEVRGQLLGGGSLLPPCSPGIRHEVRLIQQPFPTEPSMALTFFLSDVIKNVHGSSTGLSLLPSHPPPPGSYQDLQFVHPTIFLLNFNKVVLKRKKKNTFTFQWTSELG